MQGNIKQMRMSRRSERLPSLIWRDMIGIYT
jgi:hypothetical protein